MAPKDPRSLPLLNTIVTELSVGVEEAGERQNSVPNLRFISCRILTDPGRSASCGCEERDAREDEGAREG